MKALPPESWIGVLGGGQLGRMLALETRRMGYRLVTWTGVEGANMVFSYGGPSPSANVHSRNNGNSDVSYANLAATTYAVT